MPHPLDNPIHASLTGCQRAFALEAGGWRRYPRDVAPFVALDPAAGADPDALALLVAPGETVYTLGERPPVPTGWTMQGPWPLAQMVCEAGQASEGAAIEPLTGEALSDVHALAALVYPHYFRARTPELGRYFGIRVDGALAAMAGERMATDTWQEVSAVCTHPDHLGRGHARHLLVTLSNDILAQDRTPFLHVSQANTRAKALYLRNGYVERCTIDFWGLARPD